MKPPTKLNNTPVLIDYQNLVDNMVRAPADALSAGDRNMAIELARLRYSSDAERKLTQDVVWPGTGYLGPLPAGWVDGSYLVSAEYPIGAQPVSLIEIAIYLSATDQKLVTTKSLPAGAAVRVQFTAPHLLEGVAPAATLDTIPLAHREAVANYAAHVLFRQLAAIYSSERETAINADGSNTESRARNYSFRAKEARAAYYGGIGKVDLQGDKGGAAAVTGDAAASVSSWSGRGRANLVDRSLLS